MNYRDYNCSHDITIKDFIYFDPAQFFFSSTDCDGSNFFLVSFFVSGVGRSGGEY